MHAGQDGKVCAQRMAVDPYMVVVRNECGLIERPMGDPPVLGHFASLQTTFHSSARARNLERNCTPIAKDSGRQIEGQQ